MTKSAVVRKKISNLSNLILIFKYRLNLHEYFWLKISLKLEISSKKFSNKNSRFCYVFFLPFITT